MHEEIYVQNNEQVIECMDAPVTECINQTGAGEHE